MASTRGEFSSRFGFIMAASGSAVGLGNIWGFPTQAAGNGGAAFLVVYLVLAFTLAYPALMAELIIGRHAHSNPVQALRAISRTPLLANIGAAGGMAGLVIASPILSFYAIVAGWMVAFCLASLVGLMEVEEASQWLTAFGLGRNLVFTYLFIALTALIVTAGVKQGIERWSERLMPILIITLLVLIAYVLTLEGATEGLRVYLLPDFSRSLSPDLILRALGAAFFSLSLGVGTMLVYGSYVKDDENLPLLGGVVTLIDISIAVLAGFLILPAMYVALQNGVEIFGEDGTLISEDTLIFTVLPELFATMGTAGVIVSITFFFLMSIAALTSSISMLEVSVAYATESRGVKRRWAAPLIACGIAAASTLIIFDFSNLFSMVITLTTRYGQPLLGFIFCLYAGWIWQRDGVLQELRKGNPDAEHSLFWKIWPWYVRLVCPTIILCIFAQATLA